MEFGMQIADFTWNGGAAVPGPALAEHARNAEDAGITEPGKITDLLGATRAELG
jgi:hypothetical protein